MRLAMAETEIGEPLRSFLEAKFEPLAQHMRNQPD
jgi:truncated hemoglobin YjbI